MNAKDHSSSLVVAFASAALLYALIGTGARLLHIAPEFTPNFGLDERLQFLKLWLREPREGSVRPGPTGIILGSSVASNDVSAALLKSRTSQPFVNLGAFGLDVDGSRQLYEEVKEQFAIREVLFPLEFFDLRTDKPAFAVPEPVFRRYVGGGMSFLEETSYRDLGGLLYYLRAWRTLRSRTAYSSVVYTPDGDVPLAIGQANADPRRWAGDVGIVGSACGDCMRPLLDLCRAVVSDHRPFLFILTPFRRSVFSERRDLQQMEQDRIQRIPEVMQSCGGSFVDFGETVFDDSCFADFAHLNEQGAQAFTEMLVEYRRNPTVNRRRNVSCGRLSPGS